MGEVLQAWFGDPAHRHLLLNHVPIVGLAFAGAVLVWAVVEDRWRSIAFGLVLCLLASASSLAVLESGDAAYPRLFDELDGHGQGWLDHHAWLAERWGRMLPANAVLAGVALVVAARRVAWRRRVGILVCVTSLASLVGAGIVAEAGGKIRHAELRSSNPPSHSSAGRIR